MTNPQPRQGRVAPKDCPRCGWRDRPGHLCTRYWGVPRSFLGVSRSGFRTKGKFDHAYWAWHWRWRGDHHKFLPRPSLGEHINVSARGRRERAWRESEAKAAAS